MWGAPYYALGIFIIDSGGKLVTLQYWANTSGTNNISVNHYSSTTSFNSSGISKPISASRTWWLRANNDGTHWNFSISPNGTDWLSLYSEGLTAFLGPTITSLGVYGDNADTTGIGLSSLISIWSYELAAGSGTNSSW